MRRLTRYSLLLTLIFTCATATSFAQNEGAASKQPASTSPLGVATDEKNPNSWKEFSSTSGRFAILFPGTPAEGTEISDTTAGKIPMHTFALDTDTAGYAVVYSDYPFNLETPPEVAKSFLTGAREGTTDVGGRLLETKDLTVEGHPGLYLKVQASNGNLFISKTILVGTRCYTLTFATNEQGAPAELVRFHEEAAKRFLDSFSAHD